jgi:hypothetical protein
MRSSVMSMLSLHATCDVGVGQNVRMNAIEELCGFSDAGVRGHPQGGRYHLDS